MVTATIARSPSVTISGLSGHSDGHCHHSTVTLGHHFGTWRHGEESSQLYLWNLTNSSLPISKNCCSRILQCHVTAFKQALALTGHQVRLTERCSVRRIKIVGLGTHRIHPTLLERSLFGEPYNYA